MILVSFVEILTIAAVLPFLWVLTAPNRIFMHPAVQPFIQILGLTSADQLLLPLTIAFGLAALMAGAMRLLLLWANMRIAFAAGADLSINIYRRTLYQPYAIHIMRNSSEVINGITGKANSVIYDSIEPVLNLICSGIMLVAIMIVILTVEPIIAMATIGSFGLMYGFIIWAVRNRLLNNSRRIALDSTKVIKSLQEGLGGIRDVLINGSQATYCQIYRNADFPLRRALGNNRFIGSCPRYAMEAIGMVLIAAFAYTLAQQTEGVTKAIPILGTLVFGAQRLLPVLQQGYTALSYIKSGQASLQDTVELLDQPLPDYADKPAAQPLPFHQQIDLKQLSFRYCHDTPWVLKNINLTIPKGSRIGFMGVTGSGKSTFLDIVMGLLQPTAGTLEIDGQPVMLGNNRAWQAHIAHVPQDIYLADSSIEENIAFGVPKEQIDDGLVRQAAQQAQIADTIKTWPKQYQTFVGERGIRLSGGQRQRIGIARALYKQADVIIFDEATSALDSETENAVMQAIEGLSEDLTIIMVAHRLTTLKNCTHIVELSGGEIKRTGTYQDIMR